MSESKFFDNPFEDYSKQTSGLTVNEKFEIVNLPDVWKQRVDKLWQTASVKFKNLDFNDYSVYTGTAGIALLKLLRDAESVENLKEAQELLSLKKLRMKRCTFLCGDAGPLAIGAVIDYKLGRSSYMQYVEKLLAMRNEVLDTHSDLPNEYLFGRAGYLFAILFVNKHVAPHPFESSFIRNIIETILTCGRNLAKSGRFKCPLMYEWHESYYLGAAHGLSGILYLLLQAKEYLTETELNTEIKRTVDYLATLQFPSGNFPSSLGRDNDKYVQWCHGAPGFLYLFATAYKVFNDNKYLDLAKQCADVIWQRGLLRKGYSLCHGVAGNAYCFLELYQTNHDEKYLYRAVKFAEWCLLYSKNHEEHTPDRPLSLFEGIAGPLYLLLDIQKPIQAKFPGFTL